MYKTVFLIALGFLVSFYVRAEDKCNCNAAERFVQDQQSLLEMLESSKLEFAAKLKTESVRGVLSASYYYCENDSGFLFVKLHDKELLYKDVPLQTWFEFKYSSTATAFYKAQIKYNYIAR